MYIASFLLTTLEHVYNASVVIYYYYQGTKFVQAKPTLYV